MIRKDNEFNFVDKDDEICVEKEGNKFVCRRALKSVQGH